MSARADIEGWSFHIKILSRDEGTLLVILDRDGVELAALYVHDAAEAWLIRGLSIIASTHAR